jgi:hypothetical protein
MNSLLDPARGSGGDHRHERSVAHHATDGLVTRGGSTCTGANA